MEAEEEMMVLKASVVIPCYALGHINDIKGAVRSVRAQTLKPCEIILCTDLDEEFRDELAKAIGDGARVVMSDGTGSARARNAGIRASKGDVVAFIDDDAVASLDWLDRIIRRYEAPSVVAVGGRIISVWEDGRPGWFPEELDWIVGGTYKGFTEAQGEIRNLLWPNMSFRRDACDRVGYVREDMGAMAGKASAGDETEFCMRMRKLIPGGKIAYESDAVVYHRANKTTLGHLIRRSYGDGRCKSMASKVFSGLDRRAFSTETGYLRFLLFGAIPEKLRKGKPAQAGAMLLSILAFGLGYLRGKL